MIADGSPSPSRATTQLVQALPGAKEETKTALSSGSGDPRVREELHDQPADALLVPPQPRDQDRRRHQHTAGTAPRTPDEWRLYTSSSAMAAAPPSSQPGCSTKGGRPDWLHRGSSHPVVHARVGLVRVGLARTSTAGAPPYPSSASSTRPSTTRSRPWSVERLIGFGRQMAGK